MAAWINEIEAGSIIDGDTYFVAKRSGVGQFKSWFFFSENRAGKKMMSEKPGIAIRFNGDEKLRELLRSRQDLIAVKVPADADKRWRARRC